jgi:hypothetical protein
MLGGFLVGTRADFYVGSLDDDEMDWIGSVAYDGHPDVHGNGGEVVRISSLEKYKKAVLKLFLELDHATLPKQGWPWPWDTSRNTDYSYIFNKDDNCVYVSNYGSEWINTMHFYVDKKPNFPDMSEKKNVAFDGRSGLMILRSL